MIIFYVFTFSILFSSIDALIFEYKSDILGGFFVSGFMCGSRNKPDSLHIRSHILINDTGVEYGFLSYDYWCIVNDVHSSIDRCFLLRKSGVLTYKFNEVIPGNKNEYNITSIIDYQSFNSTDNIKNCYFGVLVDCSIGIQNTSKSFSIYSEYQRNNHFQLPAELDYTARYVPCVAMFFIAYFVALILLLLLNKSVEFHHTQIVYIFVVIILICKYAFEWSILDYMIKAGKVEYSILFNILSAITDSSIVYIFLILGNNEVQRDLTNRNARFLNKVWPPYIVTTPFFIIISILYFILMASVNSKIYLINNLRSNTLYNSAYDVLHELDFILLFIYIIFFVKSKKSLRFREVHLLASGIIWFSVYPTGVYLIREVDPYEWKFDIDMIYIVCLVFVLIQLFFYLNPCSNLKLNKIPIQQLPNI